MKKIVWLIILVPGGYLALIWNSLPASIPMHFDLEGNVNRYGSKNELIILVMVLTGVNLLVYLLLPNIYRIDPKKYAAENKDRLYRISFAVVVFITAIICLLIYSSIGGNIQFGTRFMISGVGFLFAVIGNYMYNMKPNYFAGIRLPWTLSNDENWRRTHLLGGKLFFGGGLLIAVSCLFTSFMVSIIILLAITMIIALITCIYSYRLYKKQMTNT
ncbi:MAG TPA: SdpI family protein [Ferruginibacter sp.]|nr:SdpI family protein [Ferruginibacter sp.]